MNTKLRFYKGDKCTKCLKDITIKNKSKLCRSCRMLGNKNNVGKKKSIEEREKMSLRMLGDKNPMWKGDNVKYHGLHRYVEARIPKELCNCCGVKPAYDLANKGIYNRDLNNWEWLCRKCHMIKDSRMKNLKQYASNITKSKKPTSQIRTKVPKKR